MLSALDGVVTEVAQRGSGIRERLEMIANVVHAVGRVRVDEPEDDAVVRVLIMKTADVRGVSIRDRAVGADKEQHCGFRAGGLLKWIDELAIEVRQTEGQDGDRGDCQSTKQHGRYCTSIRTLSAGLLLACSTAATPSDNA